MKKYKMLIAAAMVCFIAWSGISVQAQEETSNLYPQGYVQTDNGIMWMQEDGTWAVNCWLYVGDKTYHVDENGYIQSGLTNINGKVYYLYPEGTIARSWTLIDGNWYYFNFDGSRAFNTVVDGLSLGIDGKIISEGNPIPPQKTELRQTVDAILTSIIKPEMTEEEMISACYWYMVNHHTYKRTYETPSGDWTGTFAQEILISGEGNCFRFAAGFAYLVNELGYETKVITGQVGTRKGGLTPHGWTEVNIGGNWYLFDTELQYANGKKNYYWKTYETYPSNPLVKQQEWPVSF